MVVSQAKLHGKTPLWWAAFHKDKRMVENLLEVFSPNAYNDYTAVTNATLIQLCARVSAND